MIRNRNFSPERHNFDHLYSCLSFSSLFKDKLFSSRERWYNSPSNNETFFHFTEEHFCRLKFTVTRQKHRIVAIFSRTRFGSMLCKNMGRRILNNFYSGIIYYPKLLTDFSHSRCSVNYLRLLCFRLMI